MAEVVLDEVTKVYADGTKAVDSLALELLAAGTWQGTGVLGPESFPPHPFLELLADYGEPHGVVEGDPRRT